MKNVVVVNRLLSNIFIFNYNGHRYTKLITVFCVIQTPIQIIFFIKLFYFLIFSF
jgi:hypothetical protein